MKNVSIILVVAIVIFGGYMLFFRDKPTETPIIPIDNTPTQSEEVIPESIVIESPKANQVVTGDLRIKGKAKGWFFEGSFPGTILDDQGNFVARVIVQAKGEWMTADFVEFDVTVTDFYTSRPTGTLVLDMDNPADESESSRRDQARIPLVFDMGESMEVNVYFQNEIKDSAMLDCSKVFSTTRTVKKSPQTATSAIRQLLLGPIGDEYENGYRSSINSGTELKSIKIQNGVAYVDFNAMLDVGVAGSCRVGAIRAQIEQTLKQFSTVKSVVISVDGKTEEVLQP